MTYSYKIRKVINKHKNWQVYFPKSNNNKLQNY